MRTSKSLDIRHGFTLIELLVVIAIIAILSSVVLASLNSSRVKASDQKVKSQMANFRVAAQNYFDTYGDYGPAILGAIESAGTSVGLSCADGIFGHSSMLEVLKASNYPSYVSIGHSGNKGWCSSTGSGYAISLPLKATNTYWCIDSKGRSELLSGTRHDPSSPGDDCKITE